MPATSIWDGSVWQPIQGLEGADGTDGADGATGPQGDKGDQGDQGPPGPSSVSTDAGNITTLGSDQLIYTPDNYLPLSGGTMSGIIDMGNNDINFVKRLLGASDNHLQLQASAGFATQIKNSAGFIVYQAQDGGNITIAANSAGDAQLQWRNDLTELRMFAPLSMQAGGVADINMGGDNSIFNASIITAAVGSDLIIAAFDPNVVAVGSTLDMSGFDIIEVGEITGPVAGSLIIDGANPTFGITFQVNNSLVMNLDNTRLQMNVILDMNGTDIINVYALTLEGNLKQNRTNVTGAPTGTAGTIIQDSVGSTGSGGYLGFKASQGGDFTFQGMKGYLTDGGNNSRGRLAFYYRAVSTDANMTQSAIVNENGVWTFAQTIGNGTSLRINKENIVDAPWLADIVLDPQAFYHKVDGYDQVGFIADDLYAQDERMGMLDTDGDLANYDMRAIVAVLAAKVNRLENA